MEKIENFLDFIIKWLTAFCWWVDVRFNKDSVWVSKVLISILMLANYLLTAYLEPPNSIFYNVLMFFTYIFCYFLFSYSLNFFKIFEKSKKTPNQNRPRLIIWCIAIFLFMTINCFLSIQPSSYFPVLQIDTAIWNTILSTVMFQAVAMVLSTEAISPKERNMRKQKTKDS